MRFCVILLVLCGGFITNIMVTLATQVTTVQALVADNV